jgi:prepilin-type N-terminal cleavage/methylation domain-containing protein
MSSPRTRKKRRAGYTLIEVMMAMGVLAAGAVAIMAMITASTRGNMEARQMTAGNQIAQRWIERLRRDSLNWTTGSNGVDPTALTRTNYLSEVPDPGALAPWFTPTRVGTEGATFDYYGRDTDQAGEMYYCTNVRLEWVYPGQAIRADVRVWWRRMSQGSADNSVLDLVGCAPGIDPDALTGNRNIHAVHTTTVLRYHTSPAS